jgi:hypothetical protein
MIINNGTVNYRPHRPAMAFDNAKFDDMFLSRQTPRTQAAGNTQ